MTPSLREALQALLATDIGHEWDGTGTAEERAVVRARAALAAPDEGREREEPLTSGQREELERMDAISAAYKQGYAEGRSRCPVDGLPHDWERRGAGQYAWCSKCNEGKALPFAEEQDAELDPDSAEAPAPGAESGAAPASPEPRGLAPCCDTYARCTCQHKAIRVGLHVHTHSPGCPAAPPEPRPDREKSRAFIIDLVTWDEEGSNLRPWNAEPPNHAGNGLSWETIGRMALDWMKFQWAASPEPREVFVGLDLGQRPAEVVALPMPAASPEPEGERAWCRLHGKPYSGQCPDCLALLGMVPDAPASPPSPAPRPDPMKPKACGCFGGELMHQKACTRTPPPAPPDSQFQSLLDMVATEAMETAEDIRQASAAPSPAPEAAPCPVCYGIGWTCPVCNGTGRAPAPSPAKEDKP